MAFFRQSFANLGETLRTVSLVIGLLVTSVTGVGYIYTMIADQKAMAVEQTSHSKRIGALEETMGDIKLQNHRMNSMEQSYRDLSLKVDRVLEILVTQKQGKGR